MVSDDDSGGNNNNRGSDDEGDDADEVDGDDDGDDADEVDGDDDGDEAGAAPVAVSTGKRKRGEKSTTTKLGTLTREAKKLMSDDALCRYFQGRLENIAITGCGSQTCNNCLRVLKTTEICLLVADFLVWFERKHKIDQDGILLEWYKYSSAATKGTRNRTKWYLIPYKNFADDAASLPHPIRKQLTEAKLCSIGIQKMMLIGQRRWKSVRQAATTTGVIPIHKHTGRTPPNAITDVERNNVLTDHFNYLLQLGEVRATRVIATLVDGEQGHANREDTTDMVYLPMTFGFRPCYRRYMETLGYNVACRPNGGVIVTGIDGKAINRNEFVSFSTYCRKWKKEYPQLKVSKPVEDICQYCFVFANRHRYLANHSSMEVCVE